MHASSCLRLGISWIATVLLCLAGAGPAFPADQFPAPAYIVGGNAFYLASGELNGDGWPDLAVSDGSYFNRTLLLSRGYGELVPAFSPPGTGPGPISQIAVGRLNGDALDDVAQIGGTGLRLSLSSAGGTWTTADITLPFGIGSFLIGEYTGDSQLDFAVTAPTSGMVVIMQGRGDGTFEYRNWTSPGRLPNALVGGDFDRDGRADLAVANFCAENETPGLCHQGEIAILLGRGDGAFEVRSKLTPGIQPSYMTVADFNGDSIPDLVSVNTISNDLTFLPGHGDGTFGAPVFITAQLNPIKVAAGDVNGDGLQDVILLANPIPALGEIVIIPGRRGDVPGPPVRRPLRMRVLSMEIVDLNRDGRMDLALTSENAEAYVLFGDGQSDFLESLHIDLGSRTRSVATGDLNGDGHIDILASVFDQDTVTVLSGSGHSSFQSASYPVGDGPLTQAIGDLDNDGRSDLVVVNELSRNVSVLMGRADGTFGAIGSYLVGENPSSVALGDFNGDGREDVAVTFRCYSSPGDPNCVNGVAVLLGQGDGTLGTRRTFVASPDPWGVAIGDFNRDGKSDLAVALAQGDSSILLGNGDGTFGPAIRTAAGRAVSVLVGDFNRDGMDDLLTLSTCLIPDPICDAGEVLFQPGRGDATFGPPVRSDGGVRPGSMLAGDFNADGLVDLLVGQPLKGLVSLLRGSGDGRFQMSASYAAPLDDWQTMPTAIGDFNEDGRPDFVAPTSAYTRRQPYALQDGVEVSLNGGPLPDADGDGISNVLDPCTDSDGDGFGDPGLPGACGLDDCPFIFNPTQQDSDNDAIGDACDRCTDSDHDGSGDPGSGGNTCPVDNCPNVLPGSQLDTDGDGQGDVCDTCTDTDRDGLGDPGFPGNVCARDNCPGAANASQSDADADGLGDPCDPCPTDSSNDVDHDGVCGAVDNCPLDRNEGQIDIDADGQGDACDVDDGLLWVNFVQQVVLAWQVEGSFTSYNVYRGRLKDLKDTDHDGAADQYGTCLQNGLLGSLFTDYETPARGEGFYYVVTGLTGAAESSFGFASSGAPRTEFVSCRSLYGDPPEILGAILVPSSEQIQCDFTQMIEGWILTNGVEVHATPGPVVFSGGYSAIRIEASVIDPDSTPTRNDLAQVTAQVLFSGSSFTFGQDLLDDGGGTKEAFLQRGYIPEDCRIEGGAMICSYATYSVDSHDATLGDGVFSQSKALLERNTAFQVMDCIAMMKGQSYYLGSTEPHRVTAIVARDREGNASILSTNLPTPSADTSFLCTGDPCLCCILESGGLASQCYGLPGAQGPDFPGGLCRAF